MKRNIICRFLSFVCTMALLGTSALAAQNPKGYLYDQETGELNPYYTRTVVITIRYIYM